MIKYDEEKITEVKTRKYNYQYLCDMCGCDINHDSHEINTNKMLSKKGYYYPEGGGSWTISEAYFCDACYIKILNYINNKFDITFSENEHDI